MSFGFTSASAGDSVDELADAVYVSRAVERGAVSRRRVAAFTVARALLDEGPNRPSPAPEETIALAAWLSTGRVALDEDDDEDAEEVDEPGELRERWSPVRLLRRRR